jgi:hypothetical protein
MHRSRLPTHALTLQRIPLQSPRNTLTILATSDGQNAANLQATAPISTESYSNFGLEVHTSSVMATIIGLLLLLAGERVPVFAGELLTAG